MKDKHLDLSLGRKAFRKCIPEATSEWKWRGSIQPGQNGGQEGSWDRGKAGDKAEVGTRTFKYGTWKERGN